MCENVQLLAILHEHTHICWLLHAAVFLGPPWISLEVSSNFLLRFLVVAESFCTHWLISQGILIQFQEGKCVPWVCRTPLHAPSCRWLMYTPQTYLSIPLMRSSILPSLHNPLRCPSSYTVTTFSFAEWCANPFSSCTWWNSLSSIWYLLLYLFQNFWNICLGESVFVWDLKPTCIRKVRNWGVREGNDEQPNQKVRLGLGPPLHPQN